MLDARAEVLECHHVTGPDAYVVKIIAASMKHLESVIEAIARHGGTPATSVVLSSPGDRGVTSAVRRAAGRAAVSMAKRAANGAIRR